MKKEFIIFDTEYTSWKGCNENGWHDWQKREVVQIAGLRVDYDTLNVVEIFEVYVKPEVNPILSDYFTKLTMITNEVIKDRGISFEEMFEKFKVFVGDLECFSYAWGLEASDLADGKIMNENLEILGINACDSLKYKNIASWFRKQYEEKGIDIKVFNSGAIAKELGIDDEIKNLGLDEHNAIYDCYSILEGLKFLGF